MDATLHLAEEWEKQPMLKRNTQVRKRLNPPISSFGFSF
jgi:hypothetical protein